MNHGMWSFLNVKNGFLDHENIPLDTKNMFLCCIVIEIKDVKDIGGHLGGHLGFDPFMDLGQLGSASKNNLYI